mmetsp:Transcript_41273/g.82115  ORF Transcript_41273/g.82115 Transcript_41273/m.82115 type:complete len:229 (+) Transcript_41273:56-742(+)
MGGGASSSRIAANHQQARKEGDAVPDVTIKVRVRVADGEEVSAFAWKDFPISELFKGKRVVVFSIPGAFTPVCSCDHLPSYIKHYDEILKMGIDDVYCISVNDAFVMRQWGLAQGLTEHKTLNDPNNKSPLNPGNFTTIKLIPDGAAKFTRAMGMTCRWENIGGFGERSWRYSAVFNDMKIEKLFLEEDGNIEDDAEHGPEPFEVSGGTTMIEYLSQAKPSAPATPQQ